MIEREVFYLNFAGFNFRVKGGAWTKAQQDARLANSCDTKNGEKGDLNFHFWEMRIGGLFRR